MAETLSLAQCRDILARVQREAPRVQCLTNTVAQNLTANCLLAIGARVSCATHPAEIVAMSSGAQALLVNLGTLDPVREQAIEVLFSADAACAIADKPLVLDPVFVEVSPVRMALAQRVLSRGAVIVRGNATEMQALLGASTDRKGVTWVTTGPVDQILHGTRLVRVARGSSRMTQVTGIGCAAGALIAACAAVEPDPLLASAAALTLLGAAAEAAAATARGPGSFAVGLIDALASAGQLLHESEA